MHRTSRFQPSAWPKWLLLANSADEAGGVVGLAQGGDHFSLHKVPAAIAAGAVHALVVQRAQILTILHEESPLGEIAAANWKRHRHSVGLGEEFHYLLTKLLQRYLYEIIDFAARFCVWKWSYKTFVVLLLLILFWELLKAQSCQVETAQNIYSKLWRVTMNKTIETVTLLLHFYRSTCTFAKSFSNKLNTNAQVGTHWMHSAFSDITKGCFFQLQQQATKLQFKINLQTKCLE